MEEADLKNMIRSLFEQVPGLKCDEKDYMLLALLLKHGQMNRRQLFKRVKQVKGRDWGKTLVYERVRKLFNFGFLKAVEEKPAIKGKEVIYDLSFRGLILAITDEGVSFTPQLLGRLRRELHIPDYYNSLENYVTAEAPEGEPRFVRYDIRDEAVTGMLKFWAKYCLSDRLLRITTWEDFTDSFISAINRLVDNFYKDGIPLREQLSMLGLEKAETEALIPLIQYLFARTNQERLYQVTRIITAIRNVQTFMPTPLTCLPIGPVIYYIGVGMLANVYVTSRNLVLATISERNPNQKALGSVKPIYYVYGECMLRLPDGFCNKTKQQCPYGISIQSLGKCSFIGEALQKELSKLMRL